jgi:hypothetical protein
MMNKTEPEKHLDANEMARISATLIAAIAEAKALAADSKIGAEFRELLRRAHEMHDLMVEHLEGGTEYARGLADSMGAHLGELEAALRGELN